MSNVLNELREFGLININYPDELRQSVEEVVKSWKNFYYLSAEEKLAFAFLEDNHGDGSGYKLKEDKGWKKDLKENFHVTLFHYDRLIQIANQRTFSFLNDAKIPLDKIEPLILEFSHAVKKEYKINGLLKEVKSSKSHWILRYLHYFGDQQERFEIAAPHVGRGDSPPF